MAGSNAAIEIKAVKNELNARIDDVVDRLNSQSNTMKWIFGLTQAVLGTLVTVFALLLPQ